MQIETLKSKNEGYVQEITGLKESIKEKEENIKEKDQKLTEALETSKAESTSSQAPASSEGMLFHQYNYKNCNILKVS